MWSALRVIASSARSIILTACTSGRMLSAARWTLPIFAALYRPLPESNLMKCNNLAGPSSVALSFEQPVQAIESIGLGTLHLLELIRFVDQQIRLYNASSSECFGNTGPEGGSERTPFCPRSPYAVAKAAAHWLVNSYRESYGLWATNGILFNHESPLRPERFVTRKVVTAACHIKAGSRTTLRTR